ncbi:MAG TPA: NAD(P)-dependent alcohol dehydrogenase [Bryobacteraceae bacterium]|nr:NAD(P)-dependent alcohol dehydrogenase [Bryobacteraceae bacterium]
MGNNVVTAFAAMKAGGPLEPWSFESSALGSDEVDIDVTHCGVCHTDLHLMNNDFGITAYPFVPGHEAVGVVKAIGSGVTHLRSGQRVGVGWQRGTCGECEWCGSGLQNLCAKSRPTCLAGYGGFAKSLRVDSYFAIPVPDALGSAVAAPMLCAGITVYSPLRRYLGPGSRVGIVGIGGLGHLAIQFARAMGAEVTAISTTQDKAAEATRFGAHHFVNSTDPEQMKKLAGSLHVLVDTATANLDWSAYLATLRQNGVFCIVGGPQGPVVLPVLQMIFGQYTFAASMIGPPSEIEEMFRFAALHNIRTAVEEIPLDQVNSAMDKVRTNKARYRMVLTM